MLNLWIAAVAAGTIPGALATFALFTALTVRRLGFGSTDALAICSHGAHALSFASLLVAGLVFWLLPAPPAVALAVGAFLCLSACALLASYARARAVLRERDAGGLGR